MTSLANSEDNTDIETKVNTQAPSAPAPVQQESDQEKNWRAFLDKRKEEQRLFDEEKEKNRRLEEDRIRREKDMETMKEAFKALVDKSTPTLDQDTDFEAQRKAMREEMSKLFQEEREKDAKRQEEARILKESIAIKDQMPDLVDVLSQENILRLEYANPEIAIPLARMPTGYEKTKLLYDAIKKHVKMSKKETQKIEENLSKPKSVHAGYSNETQKETSSGYLSEKQRAETYAKMQRLISGEDEE